MISIRNIATISSKKIETISISKIVMIKHMQGSRENVELKSRIECPVTGETMIKGEKCPVTGEKMIQQEVEW